MPAGAGGLGHNATGTRIVRAVGGKSAGDHLRGLLSISACLESRISISWMNTGTAVLYW